MMRILGSLIRLHVVIGVISGLSLTSPSVVSAQGSPLDFKHLQDSMRARPKPVLLLLSTDWCVYCKMQKFQIQKSKKFRKSSNHLYYAELNAESKEPLMFKGRTYRFLPNGESSGVHELAVALGKHNGTLAYPTWVVMDKNLTILYRHSGVLNAHDLQRVAESLMK